MSEMNINDFILAEGDETRKQVNKKPMERKKTNYVKLRDGESLRGFLLTTDFVMYINHGDFNKRIKSHTCKDPKNGVNCLSCQHGVKRTKKTIVPFYNVDTKQVEIFDASNGAMKAIYAFTDEYEGDSTVTPISLKRAGGGTDTTYSIMPIRVKAAEQSLFEIPKDIKIDAEFYEGVLNVPDDDYVRELLGLNTVSDADIQPLDDEGIGEVGDVDVF